MHFEILVEDQSGKLALEVIVPKILGETAPHTFKIISYKGIGRLPRKATGTVVPSKRILLDRLPALLRGYGKSLGSFPASLIVVVDLDDKDCTSFKDDLVKLLNQCNPQPTTLFRIAIEEGEAWLLGDKEAVVAAYPKAKQPILDSYTQDSICGTWEKLADAVYPGGAIKLKKLGWPHIGMEKCNWAKNISSHMNINTNQSKSFQVFRNGIQKLAEPEIG